MIDVIVIASCAFLNLYRQKGMSLLLHLRSIFSYQKSLMEGGIAFGIRRLWV